MSNTHPDRFLSPRLDSGRWGGTSLQIRFVVGVLWDEMQHYVFHLYILLNLFDQSCTAQWQSSSIVFVYQSANKVALKS